ncbi:beta-glucoside-specific phosphotransferase system enzyme II [Actinomadura verrucosospora]|uniref:Beta-glucoside-specific phosphotransferase system enzyme II n=1 Tax=Actinomadura verrucosospora TaxID=46165 RepID=A0A7D3W626_ACTVE|nr:beta-glucoside-specific phosphotransferase system enzyme II [Actinomadura verrucosospora]
MVALFAALIVMGLLGLGGYLLHDSESESADRAVGLAVAITFFSLIPIAFVLFLIQGRRLKRHYEDYAAVWPTMMHVWQSAMICLRCHGAFFPADTIQTGIDPGHLIPLDAFRDTVVDVGNRIALAARIPPAQRSIPPGPTD